MVNRKFAEEVRDHVRETLGSRAISAEIRDVIKANNTKLTAIVIQSSCSNVAPMVYLEYFEANDMSVEETTKTICDMFLKESLKTSAMSDVVDNIRDWDKIKDKICFRLYNMELNKTRLADVPYIKYLDLAVTFFIVVKTEEPEFGSIMVTSNLMETWGKSITDLSDVASVNTPKYFPIKIKHISDIIGLPIDEPMYVATTTSGSYGATVLLYDKLLNSYCDKFDDDLIILPSSIHDCIIIPKNALDVDKLNGLSEMVRSINQSDVVDDIEVLSDQAYVWCKEYGLYGLPEEEAV